MSFLLLIPKLFSTYLKKEKRHIPTSFRVKRSTNPYRIILGIHQMPHSELIETIAVQNGKIRKTGNTRFEDTLKLNLHIPGTDIRSKTPNRRNHIAIDIECFLSQPSDRCTILFTLASKQPTEKTIIPL